MYEALGAVADGRVNINGNEGKVVSSKDDKTYVVKFDGKDSIMANDNGSYWQGYLGYPSIAFLMKVGKIEFDRTVANSAKGVAWKDINKKFKRDYDETEKFCLELAEELGVGKEQVKREVDRIYREIEKMNLQMFGKKIFPPK